MLYSFFYAMTLSQLDLDLMEYSDKTLKKFKVCYQWIKSRCNNKNNIRYDRYWWRWIKCLWNSYDDFYNDMYESFKYHISVHWIMNTSIDRIDNNWNYCKENCRWATNQIQRYNLSTSIKYWWLPLVEYCKEKNINYNTVISRMKTLWRSLDKSIKWGRKCESMCKPVKQMDDNCNTINTFDSITNASKCTWVWLWGIAQCLNWKYKKSWWFKRAYK